MTLAAMPSPRGTNRERLFTLSGRRLAHDAAMSDPENGDDPVDAVVAWAKAELDTSGRQRLIAALSELDGATDDLGVPGRPGAPRSPGASDEIPFDVRFPDSKRFR